MNATAAATKIQTAAADARRAEGYTVSTTWDEELGQAVIVRTVEGQPVEIIAAEGDRVYANRLAADTNPYLRDRDLAGQVTEGRRIH